MRSYLWLLLVVLLLNSCSEEPFPRCVSAEDFGSPKESIVALVPKGDERFIAENGESGDGFNGQQVVRWKKTGFITTGEDIVIKVSGFWSSWARGDRTAGVAEYNQLARTAGKLLKRTAKDRINGGVISDERICGPYATMDAPNTLCANSGTCLYLPNEDYEDRDKGAYGKPCWFENGCGAYLLFKSPDDPDPNASLDIMKYPLSPIVHLCHKSVEEGGTGFFQSSQKIIRTSNCGETAVPPNAEVYVKILDRYYWDNSGGYVLEAHKGIMTPSTKVFEKVREVVFDVVNGASERVFKGIVLNNDYVRSVRVILVIFIVISSILYLMGLIQQPKGDIAVRLIKISIVVMLISPNSWEFFHNYVFSLWIDGMNYIIATSMTALAGNYVIDFNHPFQFLDFVIAHKIFAKEVWLVKMKALMIANPDGVLAVTIIIIIVFLFLYICISGFVLFLTGMLAVSFIMSTAPIFMLAMLFQRYKQTFDAWFTQMTSFTFQSIVIFTMLALFSNMILYHYYRIFGFTACYNTVFRIEFPFFDQRVVLFSLKEFTPGQVYKPFVLGLVPIKEEERKLYEKYDIDLKVNKLGGKRFHFTGGAGIRPVPPNYDWIDFRYHDFPFLDPDPESTSDSRFVIQGARSESYQGIVEALVLTRYTDNSVYIARNVENVRSKLEELKSCTGGGCIYDPTSPAWRTVDSLLQAAVSRVHAAPLLSKDLVENALSIIDSIQIDAGHTDFLPLPQVNKYDLSNPNPFGLTLPNASSSPYEAIVSEQNNEIKSENDNISKNSVDQKGSAFTIDDVKDKGNNAGNSIEGISVAAPRLSSMRRMNRNARSLEGIPCSFDAFSGTEGTQSIVNTNSGTLPSFQYAHVIGLSELVGSGKDNLKEIASNASLNAEAYASRLDGYLKNRISLRLSTLNGTTLNPDTCSQLQAVQNTINSGKDLAYADIVVDIRLVAEFLSFVEDPRADDLLLLEDEINRTLASLEESQEISNFINSIKEDRYDYDINGLKQSDRIKLATVISEVALTRDVRSDHSHRGDGGGASIHKGYDAQGIDSILAGRMTSALMYGEIVGMIILTFLLWNLREFVFSLAASLAGASPFAFNLGRVAFFDSKSGLGALVAKNIPKIPGIGQYASFLIPGAIATTIKTKLGQVTSQLSPNKVVRHVPGVGDSLGKGLGRWDSLMGKNAQDAMNQHEKNLAPLRKVQAKIGSHIFTPSDLGSVPGQFAKFATASARGHAGGPLDMLKNQYNKQQDIIGTIGQHREHIQPAPIHRSVSDDFGPDPYSVGDAAVLEEQRQKEITEVRSNLSHIESFAMGVNSTSDLSTLEGYINGLGPLPAEAQDLYNSILIQYEEAKGRLEQEDAARAVQAEELAAVEEDLNVDLLPEELDTSSSDDGYGGGGSGEYEGSGDVGGRGVGGFESAIEKETEADNKHEPVEADSSADTRQQNVNESAAFAAAQAQAQQQAQQRAQQLAREQKAAREKAAKEQKAAKEKAAKEKEEAAKKESDGADHKGKGGGRSASQDGGPSTEDGKAMALAALQQDLQDLEKTLPKNAKGGLDEDSMTEDQKGSRDTLQSKISRMEDLMAGKP